MVNIFYALCSCRSAWCKLSLNPYISKAFSLLYNNLGEIYKWLRLLILQLCYSDVVGCDEQDTRILWQWKLLDSYWCWPVTILWLKCSSLPQAKWCSAEVDGTYSLPALSVYLSDLWQHCNIEQHLVKIFDTCLANVVTTMVKHWPRLTFSSFEEAVNPCSFTPWWIDE
jgi:hypothetical protein